MIDKGEHGFTVLPVLLHGDSAFAGQGVVAETLNLSQLRGYRTGGTVHVVINNQVGFTTSPTAARSSLYSTDVARMVNAPIFHVNGDDPEACVRVARLAVEYRQAFRKDVVIDLVCYRRRGHNEGDDPSMTQPQMYDIIDRKRSVRKLYTEALVGRGDITLEEAEEALKDYRGQLERAFAETHDAQDSKPEPVMDPARRRSPRSRRRSRGGPQGHRRRPRLLPADFPHPKLQKMLEKRAAMASEGNIDWAMGELLAFGSLLMEASRSGSPARTPAAAPSCSGTRCSSTGDRRGVHPLATSPRTRRSSSSTTRCSASTRRSASSTATRWPTRRPWCCGRPSSATSSTAPRWSSTSSSAPARPSGASAPASSCCCRTASRGRPDHSSGRIERFLQLSAENNMTVANCTTPGNYFHLLRRQALSDVHRPLVVFTPKSLLRAKAAISPVEDFTEQNFRPVLPDTGVGGEPLDDGAVRRVLLCSGKVAYDLMAQRESEGTADVAVVRVEQLYPLPAEQIRASSSGTRTRPTSCGCRRSR